MTDQPYEEREDERAARERTAGRGPVETEEEGKGYGGAVGDDRSLPGDEPPVEPVNEP
jgi:hypothetical protein